MYRCSGTLFNGFRFIFTHITSFLATLMYMTMTMKSSKYQSYIGFVCLTTD